MPRILPLLLLPALLLSPALSVTAPAGALPTLNDLVSGEGNATSIQLLKDDLTTVEGGLYEVNRVCTDCVLRITLWAGDVTVVHNGVATLLTPGAYEVREFQGLFSHSSRGRLGDVDFRIAGNGKVNAL